MMSILHQSPNQSTILPLNAFFHTVISQIISSSSSTTIFFLEKNTVLQNPFYKSKNCHFNCSIATYIKSKILMNIL